MAAALVLSEAGSSAPGQRGCAVLWLICLLLYTPFRELPRTDPAPCSLGLFPPWRGEKERPAGHLPGRGAEHSSGPSAYPSFYTVVGTPQTLLLSSNSSMTHRELWDLVVGSRQPSLKTESFGLVLASAVTGRCGQHSLRSPRRLT